MTTRVTVTRSGGFAGLVRRAEAELDDAAAAQWASALDACAPTGVSAHPDAFVYEIRLGERTVVLDEPALPADLRALIAALLRR